ncbi:MAG: NUMOD3 domain-containing DNA-binding protein [Promethearchaeota archaeon]
MGEFLIDRIKMINICDYGCGQEAKYQFKNGKWCCSKNTASCPEIRRKNKESNIGKSRSIETRRKQSKAKIGIKNPRFGIPHSNKTKRRQSISNIGMTWEKVHGIEKTRILKDKKRLEMTGKHNPNQNCFTIRIINNKYSFFSQIEEMRYNPDKPGEKEIQVHCKNHLCPNSKEQGGWFTPSKNQLWHRINTLENPKGFGESHFYCSEECKYICPLYNLQSDPFKNTEKVYTESERQLWRQKVLKREEYICEFCGGVATIAHHEKPVKTHPLLALDPDNGIACCKECHYKYGHKTGTECSTGALANKIC